MSVGCARVTTVDCQSNKYCPNLTAGQHAFKCPILSLIGVPSVFDQDYERELRVGDIVIHCFTMFTLFLLKDLGFSEATLIVGSAKALLAHFPAVSINEVKVPDAGLPGFTQCEL